MRRCDPFQVLRRTALFLVGAAGLTLLPSGPAKAAGACVTDARAVATRAPAPTMVTGSLPAPLVASLDDAVRASLREAATPGAIVGVRAPQGTWTAAYGVSDPATGAPMQVGMHTRIGSVTKTFIGTVLLQLAEAGRLSIDDPISRYVDGVPNGDRISLRLLANMTSGVAGYTREAGFTDVYFADPSTVITPDRLLAVGLAASPAFEPGTAFDYSNTNTILLGFVIEKVTGQPIADVLRRMVIEPLRLNNTSWPGVSPDMPAPFAQGFTLQGNGPPGEVRNATHWNPAWGWTAGEIIADLDDMLVYGRALGTGQGLLGPDSQATRLTSFPQPAGYGIAMGCSGGWVGHAGELPGYNTTVFYDTQIDTTVVVQTNSDIASGACDDTPMLANNAREIVCSSPAVRIFVAVAAALGRPFRPAGR